MTRRDYHNHHIQCAQSFNIRLAMNWYGNYFMYDPQRFLPLTPFEAQVFVLESGRLNRFIGLPPPIILKPKCIANEHSKETSRR